MLIYDWTLSNVLPLFLTLSYYAILCYILNHFVSLGTLTYLGTAASVLSVNLVPLTILIKQLKSIWLAKRQNSATLISVNHSQMISAYFKSLIWLSYGLIKCAKPMLISHSLGICIITCLYLARFSSTNNATKKLQ